MRRSLSTSSCIGELRLVEGMSCFCNAELGETFVGHSLQVITGSYQLVTVNKVLVLMLTPSCSITLLCHLAVHHLSPSSAPPVDATRILRIGLSNLLVFTLQLLQNPFEIVIQVKIGIIVFPNSLVFSQLVHQLPMRCTLALVAVPVGAFQAWCGTSGRSPSLRAFGSGWSCVPPRGVMTAACRASATSPAARNTACWCGPVR